MNHLFCFGFGFSARALAKRLRARGWAISGTSRTEGGAEAIAAEGDRAFVFDGSSPLPASVLDGITHAVISAPPGEAGDPVLRQHRRDFAERATRFHWVGYLSTTGVYGDRGGDWVDETSPLAPNTERGRRRFEAESQWLDLWLGHRLPVHVFRLAGIYGPGRNQLESVRDGTARRIIKEGQIFSRIHVEDVATVLEASMARPDPGRAYNVCDDEPCPPQEVVSFAARLLGLPEPPAIAFEEARLTPMARSFYADSKRVSNARIKRELGVALRYPTYREGLGALLGTVTG